MEIKFDNLRFAARTVTARGTEFSAYVLEREYPSGYVEAEVSNTPWPGSEGRRAYWTNTSGATSSELNLGYQQVVVTDIPAWFTSGQGGEE
jgi:hypothetical protein